jgi:Fe-S oxidoreductase
MRILDNTDLDYTVLGDNELCCGAPIFRMGETELGMQMVNRNVENIRKLGVKRIFASCAGCYSTMKKRFPDEFEYLHLTELLDKMLKDGDLKFKKPLKKRVIYYDGCDLGRHSGVYEAPRNVLKAIPEIELIEFDYNRENAMCCGGPLSSGYPELAHNIAARTVQEAHDKNADMIVTACAACLVNFKEGAKVAGVRMDVQDIPMILTRVV